MTCWLPRSNSIEHGQLVDEATLKYMMENPYPCKLGVVKEGAFADLILVNGNPYKILIWLLILVKTFFLS